MPVTFCSKLLPTEREGGGEVWRLTHVERSWAWASSRAAWAVRKCSGNEEGRPEVCGDGSSIVTECHT